MIYWQLLKKTETGYEIIDRKETNEMDPNIPEFEKEGDIILGFKDTGIEAYPANE